MTDHFGRRVAVHRALDRVVGEVYQIMDGLRGLGIEGRGIKTMAALHTVGRLASRLINPYEEADNVNDVTLKRLMHAVFDLRPGWNQMGETWVWLENGQDGKDRPSVEGHTQARGGEDAVWGEVRAKFFAKVPCASMGHVEDGSLRVTADRPMNVRPLTTAEWALADRVRKYVKTQTPVSLLFWGPQGSAKTTKACSIAHACTGGYFRLTAASVHVEVAHSLAKLQPGAVVIDDIDRVHDVSLLDFLDALTAAGVVTICTSNTAPDARHDDDQLMDAALVRSGRMDIHVRVAGLDPESHSEICRSVGLDVDLGPSGGDLLASDLARLGRALRAGDLDDPHAAVDDLLQRRTNTKRTLRAVSSFAKASE